MGFVNKVTVDVSRMVSVGWRGLPRRHGERRARRIPQVDGRRQVTLIDGAYHDVDSSEMAFKIAGSMAFGKAHVALDLRSRPVMAVEVTPRRLHG